jgi:hypothetical protein
LGGVDFVQRTLLDVGVLDLSGDVHVVGQVARAEQIAIFLEEEGLGGLAT